MKKHNISLLLLVPMMLTSCNSNANAVGLPNKGTEITAEEGKAKFKQSYDAKATSEEGSNDAFELSLSNVSFNLDLDISTKDSDGKATTPYTKFSFKLSDLSVSFAMKGLTSSKAEDIKGYMGIEFTLEYNYEAKNGIGFASSTVTSKLEKKKYSVDAYLDSTAIYFDLSNENVLNLLKSTVKNFYPDISSSNGLYYIENQISDNELPLIKASDVDVSSYTKIESSIINMENEGTFKSHGNDTYSYSYSMNGTKLNEEINKNVNSSSSSSVDLILNYAKYITVDSNSKFEYAVIYNTNKGISSIGYNEDLNLNFNDTDKNLSGTITSSSSAKLSFDYGSGVKVKELSDKSGYKKYNSHLPF